jgi:hypothetical protein
MERLKKRLDGWSQLVVLLTLVMFAVAVFVKGIGHDLLLEGAVFLVSAKLVEQLAGATGLGFVLRLGLGLRLTRPGPTGTSSAFK